MKPEAIFEIEAGLRLSRADLDRAIARHGHLLEGLRRFQERYSFFACAVNQVPPFDASVPWPTEIDGVRMDTYTDWMKSAYWISVTMCPAISVPAGFTPEGLPVGVQFVGRRGDDRGVLQLASALEAATGVGAARPRLA